MASYCRFLFISLSGSSPSSWLRMKKSLRPSKPSSSVSLHAPPKQTFLSSLWFQLPPACPHSLPWLLFWGPSHRSQCSLDFSTRMSQRLLKSNTIKIEFMKIPTKLLVSRCSLYLLKCSHLPQASPLPSALMSTQPVRSVDSSP